MTKKIEIKKIKNTISYDAFISSINGLVGKVKNINLEVYFTSKKIYELEDIMFVLLNMYDNSGDMKALLVGNRNKDFISLVDNIKYGLKYRINGNISVLYNEIEDAKLPFMNELKNDKVFCIYAMQCYSNTIYGIDLNEFNGCLDVKEEYEVILKYTDYLKDIDSDQVKNIKVSCYNEIVILLNDGNLFIDGEKKLDNIKEVNYIDSQTICSISNDNVITCLTKKGFPGGSFLNNNNYHYKKILVTEFGIVALKHDGVIIYFGNIVPGVIDCSRFIDADDIDYDDTGDIIVTKAGKNYSLFHLAEKDDPC